MRFLIILLGPAVSLVEPKEPDVDADADVEEKSAKGSSFSMSRRGENGPTAARREADRSSSRSGARWCRNRGGLYSVSGSGDGEEGGVGFVVFAD